jgi:hypothetical protein
MGTTAILTGSNAPPPPEPLSAQQVTEWLNYCLADLVERRNDEIVPALNAMIEAYPQVEDDEAAALFTDNIRIAGDMERAARERILAEKRPFIDAGKTVDGWRDRFMTALGAPLQQARAILLDYQTRKAAAARAEAQRRAAEAAERARRDAEAAAAIQQRGIFDPDDGQAHAAADSARAARNAAEIAAGKPAQLAKTIGHYGAVASVRTRWEYEIEDYAAVPIEFTMLNDSAVKAAMKQRDKVTGKPVRKIPGLKWVEVASLGVR